MPGLGLADYGAVNKGSDVYLGPRKTSCMSVRVLSTSSRRPNKMRPCIWTRVELDTRPHEIVV